MKNLKIAKKLMVGFGIVFFMTVILLIFGVVSLQNINTQVQKYADQTVPAANDVWQLRRDLVSVQRYMLMALAEDNLNQITTLMDSVATDSGRLGTTLESAKNNPQIDPNQINQIGELMSTLGPVRGQIQELLMKNTEAANAEAYRIFNNVYKPGVDQIGQIAERLGSEQVAQAAAQKTSAQNVYQSTLLLLLGVAAVAAVMTVVAVYFITKSINEPIKEIESAMEALSNGNFESAIVTYESRDELGNLSKSIRETIHRLTFIIGDLSRGLRDIANGDFTTESEDKTAYVGAFQQMAVSTYEIIDKLDNTLGQINMAADQVSAGSDQVASGAQALSQGATEQASSVEELAATVAEISNQIKHNAKNADRASELSGKATEAVQASSDQMRRLMGSMGEIDSKSKEIGKIIKTIEDIAFQTNILALNAAVEAARAGAAGKGFAVVADEVRNLAAKSAEAAKSTTALIEGSIAAIDTGVKLTQATADDLSIVVSGVNETTGVIHEITEASNEQAMAIEQISAGLEQVSAVVQTNSATSEESAAASEELSGQAQMLKQLIGRFQLRGTAAAEY